MVIDFQCPHCQRILKIPERFLGMEGACDYCGGRIAVTPESVMAVAGERQPAAGNRGPAATYGPASPHDEDVTVVRGDTQPAEEQDGPAAKETGALATEAEIEQFLAAAGLDSDARPAPGEAIRNTATAMTVAGAAKRPRTVTWLGAAVGTVCVLAGLLAASLWLPFLSPLRAFLGPAMTNVSSQLKSFSTPQRTPATPQAAPRTGDLSATVRYRMAEGARLQINETPAAHAPLILTRQRLNRELFDPLLREAGIAPDVWEAFADWYYLGEPDAPDAKRFLSAEGLEGKPFEGPRRQMAALGDRIGRNVFEARLLAAMPFDAPAAWTEHMTSEKGIVTIPDLPPGRYLPRMRPEGPRGTWMPLETAAANDPNIVTVRAGEHSTCAVKLVDTRSAIRGQVVDAKTAKALARVIVTVTGDVAAGKRVIATTKEDGAFSIPPLDVGYGAFIIQCDALPKDYVTGPSFSGVREIGVPLEPIVIHLSKRPASKTGKKPRSRSAF